MKHAFHFNQDVCRQCGLSGLEILETGKAECMPVLNPQPESKLYVLFEVLKQPEGLHAGDSATGGQYGIYRTREAAVLAGKRLEGRAKGELFIQEITVEPLSAFRVVRAEAEARAQ